MGAFEQGDIFSAPIPDPEKNGIKGEHPCIIVELSRPGFYEVIGITHSFDEPITNKLWFKLPSDERTGLWKTSAAKANWRHDVHQSLFRKYYGSLAPDDLAEVLFRRELAIEQEARANPPGNAGS